MYAFFLSSNRSIHTPAQYYTVHACLCAYMQVYAYVRGGGGLFECFALRLSLFPVFDGVFCTLTCCCVTESESKVCA